MDWLAAILIVTLAIPLALLRSNWIVDYAIIVFVFNRGLRRVIDWIGGEFNPLSPISLTPLVVACLTLIPVLTDRQDLSPRLRKIYLCFGVAIVYALGVGMVHSKLGALYAAAEYVAPISLFTYISSSVPLPAVIDRWMRTIAWCAIAAAAYGWYQYLTIPPWDAFWVISVGFEGYLGKLVPTEIVVFSTMAERGPLAGFLGLALVPMILSRRWRTVVGWLGIILVFSALLLTLSRGGVIFAAMTLAIYAAVNSGAGLGKVSIGAAILALVFSYGVDYLPGADRIVRRYSTLSVMHEDQSALGRVQIVADSWRDAVVNPIGNGFGAAGLGRRVTSGSIDANASVSDAGYLEIISTFGWVGTAALIYAFLLIWRELDPQVALSIRNNIILLARALIITIVPATFAGNLLPGISIIWVACAAAVAQRLLWDRGAFRPTPLGAEGRLPARTVAPFAPPTPTGLRVLPNL